MTNLFGHRIRSELLLLYVAEGFACFLAVYLLLSAHTAATVGLAGGAAAPVALATVLALSSGLVFGAGGLYQAEAWSRVGRLLLGAFVAFVLLLPLALASLILFGPARPGEPIWLGLLQILLAAFTGIALIRLAFFAAWQARLFERSVVVVRGDAPGELGAPCFEEAVRAAPRNAYSVAFTVQPGTDLHLALSSARLREHRVWAVVAGGGLLPPAVLRTCAENGVKVFDEREFAEHSLGRLETGRLADGWLSEARAVRETGLEVSLRRSLDILVSAGVLLVALPVMLLAAAAIKFDSPGPVFYRQERVGRGGRGFMLLKFRSMVVDAEGAGAPQWATQRDPRVTRIGRFMRLTRIDELPQVLNVLRGDMAFVGPRPERPTFVEALGKVIPRFHDRAQVKPGITGWAQVNYPYGASVEDARMKLAYDLYYVKRRSLFLDLLIMVATVRVVLFQEGSR